MSELQWYSEYLELLEKEDEDRKNLSRMLGVFLDESDLKSFFGEKDSDSKMLKPEQQKLSNWWYPLAFALNPEYFNAIKKTYQDNKINNVHKIYKAWKSGMTPKEMIESGIIANDLNFDINQITDYDFAALIMSNIRGTVKHTPFGSVEVVELYNEDFDQDYLNFVRDMTYKSMEKREKKKLQEMKLYDGVDPELFSSLFDDLVPQIKKEKIEVNVETK